MTQTLENTPKGFRQENYSEKKSKVNLLGLKAYKVVWTESSTNVHILRNECMMTILHLQTVMIMIRSTTVKCDAPKTFPKCFISIA